MRLNGFEHFRQLGNLFVFDCYLLGQRVYGLFQTCYQLRLCVVPIKRVFGVFGVFSNAVCAPCAVIVSECGLDERVALIIIEDSSVNSHGMECDLLR